MADFSGTTTVAVDPDALYAYLSEVGNLPEYFARLTSAERTGGEEVRTTATLEDGRTVEGTAWFRTDDQARSVEWGAEGPHDYSGSLTVRAVEGRSEVEVAVHTTRADAGDEHVQHGIADTLAGVKAAAETRVR